ncbi:hypothetical protein [Planktothricoides raciborskii]|uniref:Uncharacterized protein n=1 Tax=Planktothricoides raciborskii GIHE-MW2 TaxID=2792601 RepID=A0AAU8JAG5_9CYAN
MTRKAVIPANAGIQKASVLHPDKNRYIARLVDSRIRGNDKTMYLID